MNRSPNTPPSLQRKSLAEQKAASGVPLDEQIATAKEEWDRPSNYYRDSGNPYLKGLSVYNRDYYVHEAQDAQRRLNVTHANLRANRAALLAEAAQLAPKLTEAERPGHHVTLRQPSAPRHTLGRALGIAEPFTPVDEKHSSLSGTLIEYQVHPISLRERMRNILAGRSMTPTYIDGYMMTDDGRVVQFTGRAAQGHTVRDKRDERDILKPTAVEVSSYTYLKEIEPLSTNDSELGEI